MFLILEQCVLFFYDFLIEGPEGTLVTSPSLSPENTYLTAEGTPGVLCESAVMDTQLLTELFGDYISACGVLGLEKEKAERARSVMARFPALKIGKYGQLMEWMQDYEEAEPGHRHISHLYGVYPGSSVTWERTPELIKAARYPWKEDLPTEAGIRAGPEHGSSVCGLVLKTEGSLMRILRLFCPWEPIQTLWTIVRWESMNSRWASLNFSLS